MRTKLSVEDIAEIAADIHKRFGTKHSEKFENEVWGSYMNREREERELKNIIASKERSIVIHVKELDELRRKNKELKESLSKAVDIIRKSTTTKD